MDDEVYDERYRKLRTGWWLGLSAVWLGFWLYQLRSDHEATVSKLTDCDGFFKSFSCGLSQDFSTLGVVLGLFVALLATPFLLIPARYIARHAVDQEAKAEADRRAKADEIARIADEQQRSERRAASERAAADTRSSVQRSEFIHKLGTVSDLLRLLKDEDNPAEAKQLRIGIAQALRDLTAKHTIEALAAMIRGDETIRLTLPSVLDGLHAEVLAGSPEVQILGAALTRSRASPE